MSYKYRVLADAPVGYWRLNEYVVSTYDDADIQYDEPGYEYNQVLSDRLYDETVTANQGFVSNGSSAIFADILPLTTSSNYPADSAGCKITNTTVLEIRNRPNKYKMFYNGTESLSFAMEFWLKFDDAPKAQNNIININIPRYPSAQVYALEDQIFFKVYGTTGTYVASKQVLRWDSQLHVMVSFSNRKIQVAVNSIFGDPVYLPQLFKFVLDNTNSMNVDYDIGPASSGNHFIINDLAFYDYVLSENLIKSHMTWANNDSKPQSYVKETSGYFFDIQDSELMYDFKKDFYSESDYQEGYTSNLVANKTGLTIDSTIESTGTWTYQVPSSNSSVIWGAKVSWNTASSNNQVLVQISYDGGKTWKEVKNAYPAVQFNDASTALYPNILVRVTINASSDSIQPRLDNLSIKVYKDLSIFSDMGAYALSPRQGSYTGDTYAIRNNVFTIMSRSKNFGIKLDQVDGKNSVATITPQRQSAGYQSVEFWFRWDDNGPDYNQYILDTGSENAFVYFVGGTGAVSQQGFSAVYVNGTDITLANKILTQGELYHFVCVYPALINNTLYLGGSRELNAYCRATYGFLALYPNALSQTDSQNRYLSYLTSNTAGVGLSDNALGSLVEYSGDSGSFNGGMPLFAYITPPES